MFQINNRSRVASVVSYTLAMSGETLFSKAFYAALSEIVVNGNDKFNVQMGFHKDLFTVTLTWKDLERSEFERVQLKCLQLYQEEFAARGNLRKIEMNENFVSYYNNVSYLLNNKMKKNCIRLLLIGNATLELYNFDNERQRGQMTFGAHE